MIRTGPGPVRSHGRPRAPMYGPLLILALLAPFLLLLGFGFGYPMGTAVWDSFTGGQHLADAYAALLDDAVFWRTLGRTLEVSAFVSVLCLVLAYPTAEFINRASPTLKPVLLSFVVVPLWSSTIARTYGWVGVFIRDGAVDRVAGLFGIGPLHLLYTQLAVIIGMVHVMLPFCLLPVYVAIVRYDQRLSLASFSLGAGYWRTLMLVKLPVLAPQLIAGTVAVFILSLGFFITPAVLGTPQSQMISNLISQQVFQRFDLPRAEAMSVVLIVAVLVTLAAVAGGARTVGKRPR